MFKNLTSNLEVSGKVFIGIVMVIVAFVGIICASANEGLNIINVSVFGFCACGGMFLIFDTVDNLLIDREFLISEFEKKLRGEY